MENSDLSLSFVERDSTELTRYSNVKSHLEEINLLEEMGFPGIFIRKVYAFLKPQSLEQAINYMTTENGIYQHNFFQNIKISNKQCYICGHPENEHINFNGFTKDDELEEEIKGKTSIGNKLCSICFETYAPYDMYELKNCHHSYCYNCWFIHLKTKIENSDIGKLKCIDIKCKEIISEEFILDIIKKDKKLVDKYKKFKNRLKILEDPNKIFCPEPNCDSYAIKDKKIKYVKCENGHNFCCICMKKPHGNNSCENELEKDFQIWKKGKIIKKCPQCGIWTEKNEGCNHMTCAECKYQWCWLCNGKYQYGHYTKGTCNGLQFYKPKSETDIENILKDNPHNLTEKERRRRAWKEPNGLIFFKYYDFYNDYNPNDPFDRLRNEECYVILYIIMGFLYLFCTFQICGIRIMNYNDRTMRNYDSVCCYLIYFLVWIVIISFCIFLIPQFFIMFFTWVLSIFYFPLFHKLWIYWYFNLWENVGIFNWNTL
jgi:hypothetical protein